MGRFKIYDPFALVAIGKDTNYVTCLECNRKLKNIMGNIKRHYERIHDKFFSQAKTFGSRKTKKKLIKRDGNDAEEYKEYLSNKRKNDCMDNTTSTARQSSRIFKKKLYFNSNKNKEEKHITTQESNNSSSNSTQENNTSSSEHIKKVQIVSLNMDREEYLKCVAKIVTELNMPLRFFDDENTFQKLLIPWTKAYGINFNSSTIVDHINNMANKLRTQITTIVANRFVCLKLDVVSKKERSIMVINIQFIKDFEMIVFTIGVLELLDDHFASYLKQQILNTLERYKIDISKVYSITKDNGSNFKKSNSILQEYKENNISDDENDNIIDQISNNYSQGLSENFVAHSIHFVAYDIIKQLNENLSRSRDAVKSLRKKMEELKINPIPVLDNAIRWSSTYEMMKSLLDTRQYVEHNQQLSEEVDWEFALKFEECFRPIVETTTILQSSQFIIGDLLREWLVCETELEELSESNELAFSLLNAMRTQRNTIMEYDIFLAALYLDQRFCYRGSAYLNDKQKKKAIFQLLIIFNKLKSSMASPEQSCDETISCPSIVVCSANERYINLERKAAENIDNKVKIETKTLSYDNNISLADVDCSCIKESLELLQYDEKLPFNTNILYYWKIKNYKNWILAKLAEIALSIPATQVTIKKAFSSLPLVLTRNKKNLSSENLESILLLKHNSEVVKSMSLE